MAALVELVVSVPGLPDRTGLFRHVGERDLENESDFHWDITEDGEAHTVRVGDHSVMWEGPFYMPCGWQKGGTLTIKQGALQIKNWPKWVGRLKED